MWSHQSLNCRSFTYVERGICRPSKIINVGNPIGLDGHWSDTKEQLSAGHEQPQVVGVGQTSRFITVARLCAVWGALQVAHFVAIWYQHTHTHTQGRKQGEWWLKTGQKTQTYYLFNFLELLWPSTDTLYDFNWGQSEKEEEHCYCKWNAPEVIVIFLAFRECTEIMNFLLIYAKVQLGRTSKAFQTHAKEHRGTNSRNLFDSHWVLWSLC